MGQTTSTAATTTTARAGFPPVATTSTQAARAGFPPVSTTTSSAATYSQAGCYTDLVNGVRTLNSYTFSSSGMTIQLCQSTCSSKGFNIAGLEAGNQCFCSNTFTGCTSTVSSGSCSANPCAGNSAQACGGYNLLNVYTVSGYKPSTTGCASSTSTTTVKATSTSTTTKSTSTSTTLKTTSTSPKTTSTTSKTTSTTSTTPKTTSTSTTSAVAATGVSTASTSISVGATYTGVPGASGAKKVFAHFMIGNTYSMQSVGSYQTEIAKAISMGIDGFACNVGSDSWQPNRLSLMYQAAQSYPNFVIFVSLDMAVLSGVSFSYLYQFITPYISHSNQYRINGKQFVSTFAGESYTGGMSDPATAWLYFKNQLSSMGTNIYFVPAFTGYGATCLGWDALDGAFSWNAWTKSTDEDAYYLLSRNNPSTYTNTNIRTGYGTGNTAKYSGKTYMAGIGPLFYTHFNYKNWVYSNDDLYTTRWDNLVAEQPDFVEIISWNDYGESHYIGDIVGSLPYDSAGVQSSSWAYTPAFDHTPLAVLTKYYITAYKNGGTYPAVSTNSLFMWYRPHSISATASNDPYGKPTCESADCPQDNIYITVLLKGSATVSVTSGGSTQTFSGVAGKNYFQFVGFGTGAPSVKVVMNGATVLSQTGSLSISNAITTYNYNLHYDAWNF